MLGVRTADKRGLESYQVKRDRTHPQSRKPDADCEKDGLLQMKIQQAAQAPGEYKKFRRVMGEKFAMNTSFRLL
ncbi:hypothetical protein Oscil6304_3941 [Oscillatoria acuminata PCC 6304]|uniref:Uncharacterized protein n=1 Tax=Oscillatoria acuminata PCC 6304 TaxID=56110 RepID=K9TN83_9CYAN|nr:hypothetical protein Oscil6304_3941 [Oscillatoria acuminata PCC 6304]